MIPLAIPDLTGNERLYLNTCIETTMVSSVGEFVGWMEDMTAEKCGAKYGVATSSGTTGLHLALIGCGVRPGDLVVIPTFTFIATANAVAHCGAIPWLMDIEPDSWTLDAEQLENELKENAVWNGQDLVHTASGRRIAAIMPVYTLGNIPDMDRMKEISSAFCLPLVADAAAALGSSYKGKTIGGLADVSVISFNGNKTVTAGGGGMVIGNDEALMKRLKHLSTTARVTAEYDHDMVGYNYRMTNIQAAVGCAQMERMEEFVAKKQMVHTYYKNAFSGIEYISTFPVHDSGESACWLSGIVFKFGGGLTDRIGEIRHICAKLRDKGIEARSFWKPVHRQEPYRDAVRADSLDIASEIWDRILTLPCSTNITEGELAYVASAVQSILG